MYTHSSPSTNASNDSAVDVAAVEHNDTWQWGWTRNAEIWNGRLAMVGFFTVLFGVLAYS